MQENKHLRVDDEILLKIYRDFSSNEAIQLLKQHISFLGFEIGVLKSENAELTEELEKISSMSSKEQSEYNRQLSRDNLLAKHLRKNKLLSEKYKQTKKNLGDWQVKYFDLLRKTQQVVI